MERYVLSNEVNGVASRAICSDLLRDLWHSFCYHCSEIKLQPVNETVFTVGDCAAMAIPAGKHYSIHVTERGICVAAVDDKSLAQGVLEMLRSVKIAAESGKTVLCVEACQRYDSMAVDLRMIHFCIFPETSFEYMRKAIRFAATLQYTHVVLEFWGMFPFRCMKELAWPCAFTLDRVKTLVREIRLLGMEPIPMLNHLGHASACRIISGKHVVLDQDPSKATLFSPDGWCWNIDNPEVRSLLRAVRSELLEVFGPCDYFHLGVDEAYQYGRKFALAKSMTDFLVETCNELLDQGCRPILWGDMWLSHETLGTDRKEYTCNCHDQRIADMLLASLDRRVIIADWQYKASEDPIYRTTEYFKKLGFDVLICPWRNIDGIRQCVKTAKTIEGAGIMETTWHTLAEGWQKIYAVSELCRENADEICCISNVGQAASATLLRRVTTEPQSYENCGWSRNQILLDSPT